MHQQTIQFFALWDSMFLLALGTGWLALASHATSSCLADAARRMTVLVPRRSRTHFNGIVGGLSAQEFSRGHQVPPIPRHAGSQSPRGRRRENQGIIDPT